MNKIASVLVAAGLVVMAAPAARADAPAPHAGVALAASAETIARVREQIRLEESRAKEMDPLLARDRQARRDVETNWAVLERHAKELRAKANEFREFGKIAGGKAQNEMNGFAAELDVFAQHDEDNAKLQHEIAERLDKVIASEAGIREGHLKHAARLKEWLAANGG